MEERKRSLELKFEKVHEEVRNFTPTILRMTEEVMMVPRKEFGYIGSELRRRNHRQCLVKAGRLAADSHVILRDCYQEN